MTKPSTNGINGRNANGQFAKGNPGGTGNPYARKVAQLRSKMLDAVGTHLDEIMESMIERARDGDVQATKLLLSYSLGKPQEAIHPDLIDVHEKDVQKQSGITSSSSTFDESAMERIRRMVAAADYIQEE